MFVDEIKVYARGGHGGRGCVAFHREAYRPKGGPSGGNGGRGGSVILEADHDLNNLIAQYYKPRLIAQNGQHGMGKGMDGASGKDLIVKVPCGTLVWRLPSPLQAEEVQETPENAPRPLLASSLHQRPVIRVSRGEAALEIDLSAEEADEAPREIQPRHPQKGELIADLTQHGQRFVLCRGGRGGLGNRAFATATRQTPRFAQPGEPGEEGEFLLELRLMAEVGLVGYPNAGKSTLLSAISKARPKIAPYPFTTLTPQVGIVEYEDFHRLTVCDVPGLIAGAHRNVGLGHAFLRHIQRCKVLVLLLDMAGTDGRLPWEDYQTLLAELELFDRSLLERARLVVANKMDEPAAGELLKQFKRHVRRVPVITISAAFGDGLATFKRALREAVEAAD
ncbi:MAG: GTPase ObgE [Verrucomicrobiae bacterium]|nr:GTPase ObgE [Verrucomicrobiae bacterium]